MDPASLGVGRIVAIITLRMRAGLGTGCGDYFRISTGIVDLTHLYRVFHHHHAGSFPSLGSETMGPGICCQ